MNRLKIVLTCIALLTLFGCHKQSSTDAPIPRDKTKPLSTCIPEAKLLALTTLEIAGNIVRGEVVNPEATDAKSIVLLINQNSICTAAPIADDVLLTAAHCVGDNAALIRVAFYNSISCESGFNLNKMAKEVRKTAQHIGYDKTLNVKDRKDDIALIFLKDKIPDGYPVYKIADPALLTNSSDMQLYGYGVIGQNQGGAGILRKATIVRERYKILDALQKVEIDQENSSGLCMGDSGGPAFVTVDGELQILGVNSYVEGKNGDICNKKGFQTLVHSYNDWIKFQMD